MWGLGSQNDSRTTVGSVSCFGEYMCCTEGNQIGAAPVSSDFSAADADDCDIDARLQALQSFLKQTKAVGS